VKPPQCVDFAVKPPQCVDFTTKPPQCADFIADNDGRLLFSLSPPPSPPQSGTAPHAIVLNQRTSTGGHCRAAPDGAPPQRLSVTTTTAAAGSVSPLLHRPFPRRSPPTRDANNRIGDRLSPLSSLIHVPRASGSQRFGRTRSCRLRARRRRRPAVRTPGITAKRPVRFPLAAAPTAPAGVAADARFVF
jgi:hypothetical protein